MSRAPSSPPSEILVIGIGNEWRGDDAAGLLVARKIRERNPPGIRVIEAAGDISSVIELLHHAECVVAVDAVQSGGKAGQVHRFDVIQSDLPAGWFNISTHAFGLAEAVAMARQLGRLPPRFIVFGIEAEDFKTGARPSSAIEAAVHEAADRIIREIGGKAR